MALHGLDPRLRSALQIAGVTSFFPVQVAVWQHLLGSDATCKAAGEGGGGGNTAEPAGRGTKVGGVEGNGGLPPLATSAAAAAASDVKDIDVDSDGGSGGGEESGRGGGASKGQKRKRGKESETDAAAGMRVQGAEERGRGREGGRVEEGRRAEEEGGQAGMGSEEREGSVSGVSSRQGEGTEGGACVCAGEHDLCVAAPTGSGKTLAYVLPVLQLVAGRRVGRTRVLVVVPTRTLAVQVKSVFDQLAPAVRLSVGLAAGFLSLSDEAALITQPPYFPSLSLTTPYPSHFSLSLPHGAPPPLTGAAAFSSTWVRGMCTSSCGSSSGSCSGNGATGIGMNRLSSSSCCSGGSGTSRAGSVSRGQESGVDVLVATPGRLVDHLRSTPGFSLAQLRILVIDEADRLLRQSYNDWLPSLLRATRAPLPSPPLNQPPSSPLTLSTSRPSPLPPPRLLKILLSATLTKDPSKLARLSLHRPLAITASHPTAAADITSVPPSTHAGPAQIAAEHARGKGHIAAHSAQPLHAAIAGGGDGGGGEGGYATARDGGLLFSPGLTAGHDDLPPSLLLAKMICPTASDKPLLLAALLRTVFLAAQQQRQRSKEREEEEVEEEEKQQRDSLPEVRASQSEVDARLLLPPSPSVLIFCNAVETTHRLALLLAAFPRHLLPCTVAECSGFHPAKHNAQVIRQLREGQVQVLVASDSVTRGIDVSHITHVISYEPPPYRKTLIHRAGRTARAGREGQCITMLRTKEVRYFDKLVRKVVGKPCTALRLPKDHVGTLRPSYEDALQGVALILSRDASRR